MSVPSTQEIFCRFLRTYIAASQGKILMTWSATWNHTIDRIQVSSEIRGKQRKRYENISPNQSKRPNLIGPHPSPAKHGRTTTTWHKRSPSELRLELGFKTSTLFTAGPPELSCSSSAVAQATALLEKSYQRACRDCLWDEQWNSWFAMDSSLW